MSWILSVNRSSGERTAIGLYIKDRWKDRNESIVIGNERENVNILETIDENDPEQDISLEQNMIEDELM